ncbi:MAG: PseG/SpsG family protein [Candidatus Omnitrophota bacterium]
MKAVILTEAGSKIGFGHLTRCDALRTALQERGILVNLVVGGNDSVARQFRGSIDHLYDWRRLGTKVTRWFRKAEAVIIDSYLAPRRFYEKAASLLPVAVYLDDNARIKYPEGIVVNGGLHAKTFGYPVETGIRYLLGTKYALLRKAFWKVPKQRIRKNLRNVMVTLGGTGQIERVARILDRLLKSFSSVRFHVVTSAAGKKEGQRIYRKDHHRIRFHAGLTALAMRDLMLRCDAAISGGGQTLNELSRCGIPTLGICMAENQRLHLQAWAKRHAVLNAGDLGFPRIAERIAGQLRSLTYAQRVRMRRAMAGWVDGQGPHRIARAIQKAIEESAYEK